MQYPEPLVARVTGVSRQVIAEARKAQLEKAVDWTLENSVVTYTAPGLKKLLGAMGLSAASFDWPAAATAPRDPSATPASSEPDPAKKNPSSAPGVAAQMKAARAGDDARPLLTLKVTAISRNPSIVHASADGGKTNVLVRVRTNANFLAGMPIQVRAPAPGSTLYYFEGHCPRWKGRY